MMVLFPKIRSAPGQTKRTGSYRKGKQVLLEHRDRHRPDVREKAAALLKIAEGASAYRVATSGLLKRRKPDTVYNWLNINKSEHS